MRRSHGAAWFCLLPCLPQAYPAVRDGLPVPAGETSLVVRVGEMAGTIVRCLRDDVRGETCVHGACRPADRTEPLHGEEHVPPTGRDGHADDCVAHTPVSGAEDPVLHEARRLPIGLDPIVSEFAHAPQMPVDARQALRPLEKRPGKPVIHRLELAHYQWEPQVLVGRYAVL